VGFAACCDAATAIEALGPSSDTSTALSTTGR
jgi:hypothetical protein